MNHIQSKTAQLEDNSVKAGIKVNAKKKVLKVSSKSKVSLTLGNSVAEEVDSFKYLVANVTKDGGSTADIRKRVTMTSTSFRRLENIRKAMNIGINTKVSLFKSLVLSVYGCETWKLTKTEEKRIDTFQTNCPRRILKNRWQQHIPNKTVLEMAVRKNISCKVRWRK